MVLKRYLPWSWLVTMKVVVAEFTVKHTNRTTLTVHFSSIFKHIISHKRNYFIYRLNKSFNSQHIISQIFFMANKDSCFSSTICIWINFFALLQRNIFNNRKHPSASMDNEWPVKSYASITYCNLMDSILIAQLRCGWLAILKASVANKAI